MKYDEAIEKIVKIKKRAAFFQAEFIFAHRPNAGRRLSMRIYAEAI